MFGRGTADDKGPAIAAIYAMRAVKELGYPLKKNVRLVLGSDEECGSSDPVSYTHLGSCCAAVSSDLRRGNECARCGGTGADRSTAEKTAAGDVYKRQMQMTSSITARSAGTWIHLMRRRFCGKWRRILKRQKSIPNLNLPPMI